VRSRRLVNGGMRPLKRIVRRPMTLSLSRALSLIVVAVAYIRAWWIPNGFWIVTLVCGPVFTLIWFPQQIDDVTFGAWYRGYQIDSHTPGIAVAAMGWVFLVLFALALFLTRHSGMR
jgi:hypothetical protein